MVVDRVLQRAMLEKLATAFPEQVNAEELCADAETATRNLLYLEGHGLVRNETSRTISATYVAASEITHLGIDFLQDDGGLTAILGTVTVKLHADTLRELLEARIATADLPQAEKKRLIDHLRELPAEALKHLTTRLLDLALERMPDAAPLLRTLLDSVLKP
ncbi:MAG: hypothetical protein IT529_06345 [Burkholderiales bacterium]|nr:hypothetical protein [Burkholderiales bacterium]